ncbi:MAG: hypothetical protein QM698_02480 [Micropepsaceae bacterium]
MQQPRYDSVTVALYDPVALNRNATRNVMYSLGFREIESYGALEDLRRAMATRDFDLVALEGSSVEDPVYDFIRRVRRGEIPCNPFAVVVVTTWLPEAQLVRKVMDAGADDLLTRPFSTAMLGERLRTHAHARKGFVVTADYVGPDRRKDASRPNSARPIDVVNSLKMKAVEGKSGYEAQIAVRAGVSEGRKSINAERMRRAAFQIGVIAGFVHQQANRTDQTVRLSDLEKIALTARELEALARQEEAAQVIGTCETIIDVAEKSMNGNELGQNSQILVRLSVALQVTMTPGSEAGQFQSELDETLNRIRARGRKA